MKQNLTGKGSAQIEAAFVMTLTITVVLLLLVYGFYLHDRTVVLATAEEYAFLAADSDDEAEELEEECLQVLKKRLLMSDPGEAGLTAQKTLTGRKYELRLSAVFRLSGSAVQAVLPGQTGLIETDVSITAGVDPKRIIRFAEGFTDEE